MPALGVIRDRRANHTESREMQLDGYSTTKANPTTSITDALDPLHWVFCYSFL